MSSTWNVRRLSRLVGAKHMKFDEETLTKEKKKGNKTTILKCPIVATIVFVYKRFSTAKTYRFILRQNVDNLLFPGIKKVFVEMKSRGKQLKLQGKITGVSTSPQKDSLLVTHLPTGCTQWAHDVEHRTAALKVKGSSPRLDQHAQGLKITNENFGAFAMTPAKRLEIWSSRTRMINHRSRLLRLLRSD